MMDFITEHAGAIGLVFFMTFFIVMSFWTYRPAAKKSIEDCAQIPFKENQDD